MVRRVVGIRITGLQDRDILHIIDVREDSTLLLHTTNQHKTNVPRHPIGDPPQNVDSPKMLVCSPLSASW